MKIVVMSDTHLERIDQACKDLCAQYCETADLVVHLGDITRPAVLDYLGQYPLEAVAGNMDDEAVLERLPVKKVILVGGFRIGLIHGWGSPQGLRQKLRGQFNDVDAILYGHTHEPAISRENGLLWFNPGSVTMGRGGFKSSIGLLEIGETIKPGIIEL